jgi:hypothetical protein
MRATVRMILTGNATRILVTDPYGREILKAQLSAASQAHHLAARTLLEALALLCNARLRVVLSAESEESSCAQGLSDGFGFGIDTLRTTRSRSRRRARSGGAGSAAFVTSDDSW